MPRENKIFEVLSGEVKDGIYCKDSEVVPIIDLYDDQKKIVSNFFNYRYCIINKDRQVGVTTLLAAFSAAFMNQYYGRYIGVITYNTENARYFKNLVDGYLSKLMGTLSKNDRIIERTEYRTELNNHSRLVVMPPSIANVKEMCELYVPSVLFIDEAAYISGIDKIYDLIINKYDKQLEMRNINEPHGIILASSSNTGSWFDQRWDDAVKHYSRFHPQLI